MDILKNLSLLHWIKASSVAALLSLSAGMITPTPAQADSFAIGADSEGNLSFYFSGGDRHHGRKYHRGHGGHYRDHYGYYNDRRHYRHHQRQRHHYDRGYGRYRHYNSGRGYGGHRHNGHCDHY